jgi:hypothetical protein
LYPGSSTISAFSLNTIINGSREKLARAGQLSSHFTRSVPDDGPANNREGRSAAPDSVAKLEPINWNRERRDNMLFIQKFRKERAFYNRPFAFQPAVVKVILRLRLLE